jgi:hypothetical protein
VRLNLTKETTNNEHGQDRLNYKPEAHIFSAGGHGFDMRKQDTSSDHWIDEFYYWLEAQGFTRPAAR